MKFNEETAKGIIEAQGLSLQTITTWKHRGVIPDKWLKGHTKPQSLTPKQKELQELILQFFQKHPVKVLSTLPSFYRGDKGNKYFDVLEGHSNYSQQQLKEVVSILKDINLSIEKMLKKGIQKEQLIEMVREFGMRPNIQCRNGLATVTTRAEESHVSYFFSPRGQEKRVYYDWLFDEAFASIKALNSKLQEIIALARVSL